LWLIVTFGTTWENWKKKKHTAQLDRQQLRIEVMSLSSQMHEWDSMIIEYTTSFVFWYDSTRWQDGQHLASNVAIRFNDNSARQPEGGHFHTYKERAMYFLFMWRFLSSRTFVGYTYKEFIHCKNFHCVLTVDEFFRCLRSVLWFYVCQIFFPICSNEWKELP